MSIYRVAFIAYEQAMYKYLTEKQEDAVVQRRYEPVWQRDVVEN